MKVELIKVGDRFGKLVVTERLPQGIRPSGQKFSQYLLLCDCGNTVKSCLGNLRSGNSLSCGCMRGGRTHGLSSHPLYSLWLNMRERARDRGASCNTHPEWDDFSKFLEWSLANGWKRGMHLCRNGDSGDYAPGNCRWDTNANNAVEAHANNWRLTSPSGSVLNVYNLAKFCRENGLNSGHMSRVAKGELPHHKGWVCIKLGKRKKT